MSVAMEQQEFDELVAEMVAVEAPRLFAVVREYGERLDGELAAWGMAFDDHVEVVSIGGHRRMSLCSPERAVFFFGLGPDVTAHLIWVSPESYDGAHVSGVPQAEKEEGQVGRDEPSSR
jgi:hypothetical protein